MSIEENKELIIKLFEEIGNGNLSAIDDCFADNFVRYSAGGQKMDKEGYKNLCKMLRKNHTDFQTTVDEIVAEGDRAAFRFSWSGTNQSNIMDGAVKGKYFEISEVYFCRFHDGKIVEFWNLIDRQSWMEQAGLSPQTDNT